MPPKGQKRVTGSKGGAGAAKKSKQATTDSGDKSSSHTATISVKASTDSGLFNLITQQEWQKVLAEESTKLYWKNLENELSNIDLKVQVFPPRNLIFNALNRTPLSKVRVVLLGQDPYHDDGQAMGLAFSVPKGLKVPPSLKNMYTELASDIAGFTDPGHGCLEKWTDQGVLLLNATLTVEAHKPNSHSKFGWQTFTDQIIRVISDQCEGVVFMLWGNFAHKKEKLINSSKHVILKDAHPSPLSFGKFKGCKCFSRANAALKKAGKPQIDWKL